MWNRERRTASAPAGVGFETNVMERLPSAPKLRGSIDRDLMPADQMAEYRRTCEEIGLDGADILVEEFRHFLAFKDMPVFNYQEVVSYMDAIATKDNPTGLGWHWCPVRPKDADVPLTFGRPSMLDRNYSPSKNEPSSDFYQSHRFKEQREAMYSGFNRPPDWRTDRSAAYSRTLPLHALKKIALIEREFKAGTPIFLVTDYTVTPHVVIQPDPFLMAVIPNTAAAHGKGRFVIDVWDEPGFGIEQRLK